ncbi:carbohydrate kinase family protein [Defluviitalea phaphyphila]|uniref:carbohydrate kinase family protein n=1 Tax=Defluviitalea phaphyphila TaxID=1473580 RepID=UPI0007308940|nr:carbohydrate kinase [Defluviitalea phaphyphila]
MEKEFDVIALGELLFDFTSAGKSNQGNEIFEACPGGAPCNVLSILCKLGKKTAFIGKIGNDQFGASLRKLLNELKIDTSYLLTDPKVNTTLAFVHTGLNGERDFSFYRNPGADMMLDEKDIDVKFLKKAKIFHFGTLSMTHDNVRKATKKAVMATKENNLLISFDPNLRPMLWESLEKAKEQMEYGCHICDILKISDNEIQFLTGKEDLDEGIKFIKEKYNIPLILLTMGSKGSRAYYKDIRIECEAVPCKAIETTGAGDTFCGCVLNFILEHDFYNLTKEQISNMLKFANAAAAIVTTRKGAIKSMPEKEEILQFYKFYS